MFGLDAGCPYVPLRDRSARRTELADRGVTSMAILVWATNDHRNIIEAARTKSGFPARRRTPTP